MAALLTTPALAQQNNLPNIDQLWNLQMIGLDLALARGFTGQGFTIGIVDNIVQADHPEFAGRWLGGFDIYGGPYIPGVDFHGTHVAGTAAGANVGVARGASLVGINVFGGDDQDANIGAGYRYGLQNGVRAFNNSWALGVSDQFGNILRSINIDEVSASNFADNLPGFLSAFRETADAGAIQVWSTMNGTLNIPETIIQRKLVYKGADNPSVFAGLPVLFPELRPYWLAVTSVSRDGTIPDYADRCGVAAQWCLAAPGGDGLAGSDDGVWSAWPGSQYYSWIGTSMAAPAVTGALAIGGEIFPNASGPELVQLVLQTATDIGARGIDPVYGWGLLNIGNIVDTIEPRTAATFANASWSRFSALGHAGSAMRQRMTLPAPAGGGVASGAGLTSDASVTAHSTGGAVGLSNPIVSGVWAAPLYGHSTINTAPASRSARSETAGVLIGVDIVNDVVVRFGIAGGYSHTKLSTRGSADSGRSDAFHVGLYGSFNSDGWFMQGNGQAAFFDQSLTRHEIAGAQGTSSTPVGRSLFRGTALETDGRFGYAFELGGGATLSPYAAFNARWQQTNSFRETGAGIFSLNGPSGSQGQLAFGPGLRWASAPIAMQEATLRVEADIAYARLTGDLRHKTNVTLLGRQIQGRTAEVGRDVLRVGGQLNVTGKDEKLSGFIGYSGSFQQRAVSHSVSAGLRISF